MGIRERGPPTADASFLARLARLVLLWWAAVFAVLTALTHAAQVAGMPFRTYAIASLVLALAATALLLRAELPGLSGAARAGGGAARSADGRFAGLGLGACCLLGLLLSVFSYRPATDDAFYLTSVVHVLERPAEAMGFAFHYIESGGEPLLAYHRGSIPFEYVQAVVAHLTGLDLLSVYYVLAPAVFGALVPLAWFLLLTRLLPSAGAAVYGTLVICLALLLMGGQERSWGHYAFDRVFEGKTVMFTVGVPFHVALTLDHFRAPGLRTWLPLSLVATAMVGCTVASAALVPLLAFVLAIAAAGAYAQGLRARLRRVASYLGTLAYPALYAVSILALSMGQVGSGTPLNRTWPVTFGEHAAWVLDDPATLVLLAAGTVAAPFALARRERRFLTAWLVAVLVLYLNPIVAPFLIHNVTSPNMYWRLFYLAPFPLVLGIAGAGLLPWAAARPAGPGRAAVLALPGLLVLAHLLPGLPTVFRSDPAGGVPATVLRAPGPRIAGLAQVRQVLDMAPPEGTMLAPQAVSTVAAMLTARYKHICYRADGIRMWFEGDGRETEASRRIMASNYLGGRTGPRGLSAVEALVERYPQVNVVVASEVALEAEGGALGRALEGHGFSHAGRVDDLTVWSRPGASP